MRGSTPWSLARSSCDRGRAPASATSSSSPARPTPRASRAGSSTSRAGRELEAHVHHDEDDAFYILEGELTFEVAGETVKAPAGTFVLVPPGVEHGFRNDGTDPVRILNIHAPAGFDRRIGLVD